MECFLLLDFFIFWGFCGSGEVARRATSLGPKPFLFVFFLSFLCFSLKNCFPPKRGIFGLFLSVSLCFSLACFGLPLFQFLSLSLSLSFSLFFFFSLSLSLSLSFSLSLCLVIFSLSSFLSFVFAFFWFLVFVFFFHFLTSLLLFHERNSIQRLNYKVLFSSILSHVLVSYLVFSFKSLFYL